MVFCVLFCKQKTGYELRISDWSSDVCSSDLRRSDDRNAVRDRREAVVRQLDDEFAGLRGLRNGGVERLLAVFGVELEEVGRGLDGGIALQRGGRVFEALASIGQDRKSTRLNSRH